MTLGLVIATPAFAALVTDRRLTGAARTDEFTKSGFVDFRDGRLVYTVAGLAAVPVRSYVTTEWLAEALCESGAGVGLVEALGRLKENLEQTFRTRLAGVDRAVKRLSIAMVGYRYSAFGRARPVVALLSNFESLQGTLLERATPEFSLEVEYLESDTGMAISIGSGRSLIGDEDLRGLANEAARSRPLALVAKAVALVRRISRDDMAGLVGPRVSSLVISSNSAIRPIDQYHSEVETTTVPYSAYVCAAYGNRGAYAVWDASVSGHGSDKNKVLTVPVVGKNRPCPCKSGRKYKACHGRLKGAGLGLTDAHIGLNFMYKALPEDGSNMEFLSIYASGDASPFT